jgi:hypothetical protein
MMGGLSLAPAATRRHDPRVFAESFCSELYDQQIRHALVIDFSARGLQLQRPVGGLIPTQVPIEFEIPEIDEVVWALGEVRYDVVRRGTEPKSLVRHTGLELVQMATRQRKLLRDFVHYRRRAEEEIDPGWLMNASCYARG